MARIDKEVFIMSDAWLFASLASMGQIGKLDLCRLIAMGDGLNHAIMRHSEIKQGLIQCQRWGLVKVINRHYYLTTQAWTIYQEAKRTRGGLFSIVGGVHAKLNSKRTKLDRVGKVKPRDFITEEAVQKAYSQYVAKL